MEINPEYVSELRAEIKVVSYSRFNKVRRLKLHNNYAMFSITALSISMIILSIVEKVYGIDNFNLIPFLNINIEIWFFSIISSVIILSISILVSSMKKDVEIDRLNFSAVSLNEIQRKLEFSSKNNGLCNVEEYFETYLNVIKSDLINHDKVDYKITKTQGVVNIFFTLYQHLGLFPYILITYFAFESVFRVIFQVV